MENKIFTVAILGVGARGGDVYGTKISALTDKFKIVSLCEKRVERLEIFGEKFGVEKQDRFTDENEFFKQKRADILIIATQDNDHYRHIIKAFEMGYDILVEKPLTDDIEKCNKLLKLQAKSKRKALVCHVLRYAPAFVRCKEILDTGKLGKIVAIDALERVAYWHQAHSYIRGNWRNNKVARPMILAKCCHDLDLLQYYANSKAKSVSSIGDLAFFKEVNAPENATKMCIDCPHIDTCPYSAKRIYIDNWEKAGKPENRWPYNIITQAPVDIDKLQYAVKNGDYGRCVFHCDNDVVDHQITTITFENGVKASLTMTGFTHNAGRRIVFHCTYGELILDEASKTIEICKFGEDNEIIDITTLNASGYGHGGGDIGLVNNLYDMVNGTSESRTSLEESMESHYIGICAEKSRINGGKLIFVHEKD